MTLRKKARPGDHLVLDDRTGFVHYASEMRREWTGAMVHKSKWEARHPQDSVRPRPETAIPADPRPDDLTQKMIVTTDVTADAAAGATSLTVRSTTGMTTGDTVRIPVDIGTRFTSTITVASATSLTLGTALPSGVTTGALVVDETTVTTPNVG